MRLDDYWGVGPKTRARLEATLGTERAIEAIESGNVPVLVEAGLSRGRATRVLRHAHGKDGMEILATADARSVYKALLDHAREHAVTEEAGDRIRVLTPLTTVDAMEARLDDVTQARESWAALDESTRENVLEAFAAYDEAGGGEQAAVETALALGDVGVSDGVFKPIAALDRKALTDAADALRYVDGGTVREGADDDLDEARARLEAVERLQAGGIDVLESIGSDDLRTSEQFREAFVEHVVAETGVAPDRARAAGPTEAVDAADFVGQGLRDLWAELRNVAAERGATVRVELRDAIDAAREEIDAAVDAVSELTLSLSLARFAEAYDLTRPAFVDEGCLAVSNARNLALIAGTTTVQSVTYAIGTHSLAGDRQVPTGDRVTVLTGANSGGKTTLLETLCQVVLLAHMGLPVPAQRAEVGRFDAVVFHRRHASFNAGVLESTLRTVVPPLTEDGRTLMLVDEFEAITEPGSAADLLHGLVGLSVESDALGVFVTHLAEDLEPLPERARTDGIFARGLDENLALDVDYQPRFDTVGRSTPEFIVSRLVANASDRRERAGFAALAEAIGQEAVQRTLLDAQWSA